MEILLTIGLAVLFIVTLVLPWVNRHRYHALKNDVTSLQKKILFLSNELEQIQNKKTKILAEKIEVTKVIENIPEQPVSADEKPKNTYEEFEPVKEPVISSNEEKNHSKFNFEQQFGERLPVWIGGVALVLGAFYLVKYSIDNNLLSPAVRVVLGGALGTVFLYAARWIREKDKYANGVKIAQSLSGAGIATLYVSVFAATSLYHFLPNLAGLSGMTAITGLAVILSLRHGAPIALLGLVSGFITPALLSYNNDIPTPILFLYLYIIFAGLMAVIKQKRWWALSLPAIIGTFLWVVFWIIDGFTPDETLWAGLFLVAVSATIIAGSHQDVEETTSLNASLSHCNILNYLGLGGAIILMGTITARSDFGYLEWGLFGALALGGIIMAYFKNRIYGFLPWVFMAVNAVMFLTWQKPELNDFTYTLCAFAILYIGCGYLITWKNIMPSRWVGLMAATSIGYYLLAYYKLQKFSAYSDVPYLWGGLAFGFAALFVYVVKKAMNYFEDDLKEKDNILGISALMATIFISLALTIELEREFLSVAIAAEVFAISWIATRLPISSLRLIGKILAFVFGFLLIPQILLLIQLTAHSLVDIKLHLQKSVPIVDWPLFQLGIPAAMFIGAAYYFRQIKDDRFVRCLELASLGLVAIMGYYLNRHAFHISNEILFKEAGFFERNVMTNILFAYGLGCLYLGRYYQRIAFSWGGMGLCAVAFFRIVYFDLITHNPLWSHEEIRGIVIANELFLPFGLPVLWAWFTKKEMAFTGRMKFSAYTGGFILLFVFVWLSLNVRFFYHGADLGHGLTTNAETYAYSVIWLLFGLTLLFIGILKKDQVIRYASLAIMILTVGKVFLHDASELDGLYRVFSFLGLGLSLLGLSYFYTRFVFKGHLEQLKD